MKKAKYSLEEKSRLKKEKKKIMCGRYVILKPVLKLANSLVKKNINVEEQDNFNCSPGHKLPINKVIY